MDEKLKLLHAYPFQRFNSLISDTNPPETFSPISWAMGEPQHPTADFLIELAKDEALVRKGFGTYPPTKGLPELREAISGFITRRFNLGKTIDAETQVLPVTGTREALFSFAQAVIDNRHPSLTVMPNPFYQIYEGAALLAGSTPHYLDCDDSSDFAPDFAAVPDNIWEQCQLLYICTPGNPTGKVLGLNELQELIKLAHKHDFIIASDECYSEIYFNEDEPPPGLLEAAAALGDHTYARCIAFNSLSKRSNLPGLRSGYVAGDAEVLEQFLLYRTYHGSAMPVHHQHISIAAWNDEHHVQSNRSSYRKKFATVTEILNQRWTCNMPDAAFYLWPETPIPDQEFAVRLYQQLNLKVLPGSFLGRDNQSQNPGANRVRIALVATESACIEAAERIVNGWDKLTS